MDIIFLGVNDVGIRIYQWLCNRDSVKINALLTEPDQLDVIYREDPDLIVSVGFDHLVPPDILSIPDMGALNLHPALLPYNRGKSPNVWPIIEGTPAGVTLHYMDEDFDTGDIIAQKEVGTEFTDTGKDVHKRLEDAQFELFTGQWPALENNEIKSGPQDTDKGTYHTTQDFLDICELNPDEEVCVEDFLNRLRALTFPPFDNAFLELDGEKYYIDIEIRKEAKEETETEGFISSY